MRKYAFFAAAVAVAWVVSASETTSSQALTAANAWAAANVQSFGPAGSAVEAVAERDASGALLWWTVKFSEGGAVIVAPDTRIEPVLVAMQSYPGDIPERHPLRTILTLDITNRLAQVKDVAESSGARRLKYAGTETSASASAEVAASATAASAKWADLAPSGPVRLKAGPSYPLPITGSTTPSHVLGMCVGFEYGGVYTHWNQGASAYSTEPDGNCYNYATPRHAECGGVAAMGAAMLQYYGNTGPVSNATLGCSWGDPVFGAVPESYFAMFTMIGGTNAYNWSILPDFMGGQGSLEDGYLTKEQVDLLGRVTYDVGVAVQMAWFYPLTGFDESVASLSKLATSFRSYYGFKDARQFSIPSPPTITKPDYIKPLTLQYLSRYSEYNRKILYAQLRNNVPVPIGLGKLEPRQDHPVLAVGYGRDNAGTSYTRIFMTWGGRYDAWYCLPEIHDYRIVNEFVTMMGYQDSRTIPLVGRVTNASGQGAAFAEVNIGGVTNVFADANGYWATRIDDTGLQGFLDAGVTNIWTEVVTNTCPTNDTFHIAQLCNRTNQVYRYGDVKFGNQTITDAYTVSYLNETNMVTELLPDGITVTNYFIHVETARCDARVCRIPVSCVISGETNLVAVGVAAFDSETTAYPTPSRTQISASALLDAIPDEISFTVPDNTALVAWSGSADPHVVADFATNACKKLFILSGQPDSAWYRSVLAYLQNNASEFNSEYVLYMINPGTDPYTLEDGKPSFGVFDPGVFNSEADSRWAFFNGRLAYFDASNGVTDDDVKRILKQGAVHYDKLHDNIKVWVAAENCNFLDGIKTNEFSKFYLSVEKTMNLTWASGLDSSQEGFETGEVDWGDAEISGLGVHINAFTNGQHVVFTAPSVVTNGNVVWEPTGWTKTSLDESDGFAVLYRYWQNFDNERWQELFGEDKPSTLDPTNSALSKALAPNLGYEFTMWETNDPDDPTTYARAEIDLTSNTNYKVTWYWRPKEVFISVAAENGSVSPVSGWYPYGTKEEDVVMFTASTDVSGTRFAGWEIDTVEGESAFSELTYGVLPVMPHSLLAIFTADQNFYNVTVASDQPLFSETVLKWKSGSSSNTTTVDSATKYSRRPGVVDATVPEAATNIVVVNDVEVTNIFQCVGWVGTGSVPARGFKNECTFVLTNASTITWLWREDGVNPYLDSDITFTVDAGVGAPEGAEGVPAAGTYKNYYLTNETVVCTAPPGVTNVEDRMTVVCDGWTLTDDASGAVLDSGSESTAEVTFNETNVAWTLTWAWKTNEICCIVVDVDGGLRLDPGTYYVTKGDTLDVTVLGQKGAVFDHWEGDTNGCVFAGHTTYAGYTAAIPADGDRRLTAVFTSKAGDAELTVKSACTNDANGVEVVWGTPKPGYLDRQTVSTGGQVIFTMTDAVVTNIVGDVTNIWECAGWQLFDVYTNLIADSSHLIAEGAGTTAAFQFTRNSSLIWIWKGVSPAPARSPLPATIDGPSGNPPLVISPSSVTVQIANSAAGWWYGLYYKTSLSDTKWTLVPGMVKLATVDGEPISFVVDKDPSEPTKFFKLIVTEEDPQ